MPSVFPGVDPYIESQGYWSDFHATFMIYWREAVADVLPDNYEARIEESVRLVEVQATPQSKRFDADIAVERRGQAIAAQRMPGGAAVLEAATIRLPAWEVVEQTERSIQILRRPDRVLVAVLELLSPANKEEPGFTLYGAKRRAILRQPVHLVEVDLLVGGKRQPLESEYPKGDYCAVVARADLRPDASVYTWTIRQPLPALPIPLSGPGETLGVDLAVVFNATFDRARYARSIDYSVPPTAIDKADAAWADEVRKRVLPT